jgi:SAM-dependent methyltransferase
VDAVAVSDAVTEWRSLAAWQAEAVRIRQAEAVDIAVLEERYALRGTCGLCGAAETEFVHEAGTSGNLREGLACAHCRCNARQRAAAMLLLDSIDRPFEARVYATEQASPLFVALRRRLPRLLGSEYAPGVLHRLWLSSWLVRHGVAMWVRCEDVTTLRLRDGSLAAVISLDVLEHVPDYRVALREFARVLRPGGVLALTVPFYDGRAETATIARMREDGSVEHFGTPEFHGDPISGGVPCFHHFGWNLCVALREAGFGDIAACRVHDPAQGLPQGQWVFRARR